MLKRYIAKRTRAFFVPPFPIVQFGIGIALFFNVVLYAQGVSPAATENMQEEHQRIGVYFGMGMNMHNGNFAALPGVLNCNSVFGQGNSIAPRLGVSYHYPLNTSFSVGMMASYANLGAEHTSDEQTFASINGTAQPVVITHSLQSTLNAVELTPAVSYNINSVFSISAGIGLSYFFRQTFDQIERISSPGNVNFENDSKTRNHQSGAIPFANSIGASLNVGAAYQLPLNSSRTLHAVPQLRYSYALIPVVQDIDWKINNLQAGVAIEYTIPASTEPKIDTIVPIPEVKPAPIPPSPPPVPPLPTLALRVVGLTNKGDEQEAARFVVEELSGRTISPLLSSIFFDSTSAEIPQRLHQRSAEEAKKFEFNKAVSSDAVQTYTHTLDILGQRVQNLGNVTLQLNGIANTPDRLPLARQRAEALRRYFVETWGIAADKMSIHTQVSTNPRLQDKDIAVEENRVDITASDMSIFAPVESHDTVRTVNPPSVRIYPSILSGAGLVRDWKIACTQSGKTLKVFENTTPIPEHIDWMIEENNMPKYPGDMNISLSIRDTVGRAVSTDANIPIEQKTLTKKKVVRVAQGEIEKYSLITFDFGSAALTEQHLQLLAMMKKSIRANSQVSIIGYTDRVGESEFNQQLSAKRAAAIAKALGLSKAEIRGVGNSIQLYNNDLPEGRVFSRTVVITIINSEPGAE